MRQKSWALALFLVSCITAALWPITSARAGDPAPNSTLDPVDQIQNVHAPAPVITPEITWGDDRPAELAEFVYPSPSCNETEPADTSAALLPAPECDPVYQSQLYFRADSYDWSQQSNGRVYSEDGPLFTLGYAYRFDQQRVRTEVFGGRATHTYNSFSSVTDTIGFRLEYERLHVFAALPDLDCFYGIGTRFWVRNLPDTLTYYGGLVDGFQQTWWTFYPYIGLETRHNPLKKYELYSMSRIGIDAFTWNHDVSFHRGTRDFYPALGVNSQVELGIRAGNVRYCLFMELMQWGKSPTVDRFYYYPETSFATLGLKTTLAF